MYKIAICEDEKKDMDQIRELVFDTLRPNEDVQIQPFSDGKDLIRNLEENPGRCNLLLLDIGMKPVDGMQVAEYIREHKLDMDIIFITKSDAYVYQGYKFKAYAYILKTWLKRDFKAELRRYWDEISANDAYMNVKIKGAVYQIPLSSIRFIESHERQLLIHQKKETTECYSKMCDVEEQLLEHGFLRIHQSYIVAKKEVCSIRKNAVVLSDRELPVSRRYIKTVREAFEKE